MSPYALAGKAALWTFIATGLLAEGVSQMLIFGAAIDNLLPALAGGGSLIYIAFRFWRDDRQWRRLEQIHERERRLAYGEGYTDGMTGRDPTQVADRISPPPDN